MIRFSTPRPAPNFHSPISAACASFSIRLFNLVYTAEFLQGKKARIVTTHALTHQVLDLHLDVRLDLRGEFVFELLFTE